MYASHFKLNNHITSEKQEATFKLNMNFFGTHSRNASIKKYMYALIEHNMNKPCIHESLCHPVTAGCL